MTKTEKTKRPYLSVFSIFSLVIVIPIANLLGDTLGPKEDLLGYGSLGVIFMTLISMLSLGLILGLASIYRKEQPKFLSFLAPVLNSAALIWFLWLLMNMPS